MLLKELVYILAVEKYGNISKAAEHLYISQPALSKYIRTLEETLDVKLLENVGRNVILTDAGQYYTQAARQMMDIYDNMSKNILRSDNLIHGSLRIGVTFTRSPMLLPEVLAKFHGEYPNVELHLFEENSSHLESQLASGVIDLIAAKGPISSFYKFVSYPLFTEEFLIGLPEGHPAIAKAVYTENAPYPWIDLRELSGECFLLLKPGHHTRFMADQLFEQNGFFPAQTIMTANTDTAMAMAAAGLGAGVVPGFFALKSNRPQARLRYFSVGARPLQRTYTDFHIMYRQDAHLTKYARKFIQLMQEHCQTLFSAAKP